MVVMSGTSFVDWGEALGTTFSADLIATVTDVIPEVVPVLIPLIGLGLGFKWLRKLCR
jgi:hypothetical protein